MGGDSTVLRSSHYAGGRGQNPAGNASGLPKVSKKMLRDKLKRAKQRNAELAEQVRRLQAQVEGMEEVHSDEGAMDEPVVFRGVGGKKRVARTQKTKTSVHQINII